VQRFWDHVIEPVLSAGELSAVVEIGAATGVNTARLAGWASANRAVVHVIDPDPRFDVEALERQFPEAFVMHRALSLEALPLVQRPDAVLIDGDHNWYTVSQELRLLERMSRQWPITFLHDVGWPYGRRDMYYDPATIPPDYRQPYERSGLLKGCSRLSPDGVNTHLAHAAHEGGARNGVLTAVEDFMEESDHQLELFAATGPAGLGLLIDRERLQTDIGRVVKDVHDQAFALQLSPRYASRYFDHR
jgi:hypothetical protein